MDEKHNNPLAGLNPDADKYITPDGKGSIARDFMAESIIAGEVSALYARASLASAEGRNDERDALMLEAHERVNALAAAAAQWSNSATVEEELRRAGHWPQAQETPVEPAVRTVYFNEKARR